VNSSHSTAANRERERQRILNERIRPGMAVVTAGHLISIPAGAPGTVLAIAPYNPRQFQRRARVDFGPRLHVAWVPCEDLEPLEPRSGNVATPQETAHAR